MRTNLTVPKQSMNESFVCILFNQDDEISSVDRVFGPFPSRSVAEQFGFDAFEVDVDDVGRLDQDEADRFISDDGDPLFEVQPISTPVTPS